MTDRSLPQFLPGTPPDTLEGLLLHIFSELRKVSTAINELSLRTPHVWTVAPAHPREGQVVWARAPWNPGGGDGCYAYNPATSAWVKLS